MTRKINLILHSEAYVNIYILNSIFCRHLSLFLLKISCSSESNHRTSIFPPISHYLCKVLFENISGSWQGIHFSFLLLCSMVVLHFLTKNEQNMYRNSRVFSKNAKIMIIYWMKAKRRCLAASPRRSIDLMRPPLTFLVLLSPADCISDVRLISFLLIETYFPVNTGNIQTSGTL